MYAYGKIGSKPNEATRRFIDLISYLVDGIEDGDDRREEPNLYILKKHLESGIARRTADCACDYEPNPEEDGAIGILKAISEYVEKEEEWNEMMDRDYPPSS